MQHVLVVDDDPLVLDIVRESLEPSGYVVDTAMHGGEAIAKIGDEEMSYDAILLDLTMPGISGYDFLDFLVNYKPALLRRIILISALDVRLEKVFASVRKPIVPSNLVVLVNACVNQSI